MLIIENFVIFIIVILFPILVYLFYLAYKKELNEKEKSLYLEFSLFSSLCLSVYFFNLRGIKSCFCLILIPVLLSYLYKKKYISIFMSIILIEFLHNSYNIHFSLLLLEFVLYFLLFIYYQKAKKNNIYYTNGFFIITIITMIINQLIYLKILNLEIFLEFIIVTILFYLVVYLINIFIYKADEILNLYNTVKDFEHEKQIKQSLFKITHEIKNPIAVVKGYLDMFDVNNKNKSIKYISIINQEINRTLNLLSDFMQFTKIKLETEEIDFNLLLDDIKNITKPLFERKNIKYKFKSECEIYLNGDYNRLKQVILNIIKNGIEACKNNGTIYITVYKDVEKLYVIIKDNGLGMTKEELNNMLIPFYTTKENGTGLGVCLSKEIIEAHKGKLSYSSIKNKETIAKIILPLN